MNDSKFYNTSKNFHDQSISQILGAKSDIKHLQKIKKPQTILEQSMKMFRSGEIVDEEDGESYLRQEMQQAHSPRQ